MTQQITAPRILVVDDASDVQALLKACLEKSGYAVFQAGNGFDALAMIKQQPPDLIIMDRMMPKMDGLKASAFIKSDRRFSHIPLIMLTSSAETADRKLSEQVGVDVFLNKPLNTAELIGKVRELLAGAS